MSSASPLLCFPESETLHFEFREEHVSSVLGDLCYYIRRSYILVNFGLRRAQNIIYKDEEVNHSHR